MSEARFAALRKDAELQGVGIIKLCEDRLFVRDKEYKDDDQTEYKRLLQTSSLRQQDDEKLEGSNDEVLGAIVSGEITGDAE